MMLQRVLGAAGVLLLCAVTIAAAQRPQTQRVRGTIETIAGNALTMKGPDGASIAVTLADDIRILAVAKASLADITPGSYIGSGAMPQADGSQKAVEVHIFTESQRGTGDGHYPWGGAPNGTMTNGEAGNPVTSINGLALTVKYKDGEKKLIVTPDTPITRFEPSNKSELKPGVRVSITAVKKPDGTFEAARLTVVRDGVEPN